LSALRLPYPEICELECKACGRCVAACPKGVLRLSEGFNPRGYHYAEYGGEGCIGCGRCFYTCPEPYTLRIHLPARDKAAKKAEA